MDANLKEALPYYIALQPKFREAMGPEAEERVRELTAERDRLRKAVTEIADKGYVVTGEDARDMVDIAIAALAEGGGG